MLRIAATLFHQAIKAASTKKIDAETLLNGVSYFTGPLLNWTLVGVVEALIRDAQSTRSVIFGRIFAQFYRCLEFWDPCKIMQTSSPHSHSMTIAGKLACLLDSAFGYCEDSYPWNCLCEIQAISINRWPSSVFPSLTHSATVCSFPSVCNRDPSPETLEVLQTLLLSPSCPTPVHALCRTSVLRYLADKKDTIDACPNFKVAAVKDAVRGSKGKHNLRPDKRPYIP